VGGGDCEVDEKAGRTFASKITRLGGPWGRGGRGKGRFSRFIRVGKFPLGGPLGGQFLRPGHPILAGKKRSSTGSGRGFRRFSDDLGGGNTEKALKGDFAGEKPTTCDFR